MKIGGEVRKIAELLRLSPRVVPFNSTLNCNGHLYMYFNEVGNRLQPEQVRSNLEFFSALSIIGVYPVGARLRSYFHPHNRNFQALSGVQMTSATAPVIGFRVPEMGDSTLHQSLIKNTMTLDGDHVHGQSNHLLLRARKQVKGPEVVVFGVEFSYGVKYYMWDEDSIFKVETDAPALLVRTKEEGLVLVSDNGPDYKIRDIDFGRVEWTNINEELVSSPDNIIVDIDTITYEVLPEVTLTLEISSGVARDSSKEAVFSGYNVKDGTYVVGAFSGQVKEMSDAMKLSSSQQILVSRNSEVGKMDLRTLVVVPQEEKKYKEPILNFCSDVTFAGSINSRTIKVPALMELSKGKNSKIDLVRDFAQSRAILSGGLYKPLAYKFAEYIVARNIFIKNSKSFNLSYKPKILFNDMGFSNFAQKGYCMIMYSDIPIVSRSVFAYRDYYLLFYDPKIWQYEGEKDVNNFLDLNNNFNT